MYYAQFGPHISKLIKRVFIYENIIYLIHAIMTPFIHS